MGEVVKMSSEETFAKISDRALFDTRRLNVVSDALHRAERCIELQATNRTGLLFERRALRGWTITAAALYLKNHV